jgi:diguanylate cyclase (GGDEF)-like protein
MGGARLRLVCPAAILIAVGIVMSAAAAAPVLVPGIYPFRTYGAEVGLGNLSVMDLAQDSTGFLWVATQDGIYRYDGTRFTRFGLEEGLPSTFAITMKAGRGGELWVATNAGLIRWDGKRFRSAGLSSGLPRAAASGLDVDTANRVWLAMAGGVYRQTGNDTFARAPGWPEGQEASALWCDRSSGSILAATSGKIGSYANGVWSWWNIPPERIDAIVVDSSHRIWIRSARRLLSKEYGETSFRDDTASLPGTSTAGHLSLDARGNLWVPTDSGLAIHEAGSWRVIGARQGLPTEWARDILEDREGSIWVASLGVHRMLGRGEFTSYTRRNGLPSEVTWCFHWDRQGRLLAGTDLGLARSTATGWTVVPGTERRQIRAVVEEEGGALWVAGDPAEIMRIDAGTGEVRRFGEQAGVSGRTVTSLLRDRSGAIWAATRGGGLLRKPPDGERFERMAIPGGGPAEDFRSVRADAQGRVWAGGERGLACLSNGIWRRFTTADGLKRNEIAYITQTASGDLWAAYFEPLGIFRFRVEEGTAGMAIRIVEQLDSQNKLGANKVFLIGEDQQRRLWVGTGIGVDVIGPKAVEHFSTADGLAGDDCDALAFLCDSRGAVYVGTSAGFSRYLARSDAPRFDAPPVHITAATLGNARIPIESERPFEVTNEKHDLVVTFAALTYYKDDLVEYQVRLHGADDEWQRASHPEARWSKLPPGDYRFEMRARLRPGQWGEPATVPFSIRPAWWQTNWARALAVLLFVALLWLAFRGRVALLRRRNAELQALVSQRTRELAAANDSLMNISVTDALTGMKNRRYLHLCMPEYTSETLRRHEVLSRAGIDATRANADLVFLIVDLDFFKEINDRYGHLAGDHALIDLHRLLEGVMRDSDTLVRWGGEELLVVSRSASRGDAAIIAERIRFAVANHPFDLGNGDTARLTCSIGFAAFPFIPEDRTRLSWEEVVDVADVCLYSAKRAGRNCWVGVMVRDCTSPQTLLARVRESLPDVVASGELEVITSAGNDQLPWALHARSATI